MRKSMEHLRQYVVDGFGPRDDGGALRIGALTVIASWGGGWDHVSVNARYRCPDWEEMCFVKGLFFDDEEMVMQLHPPRSHYINFHPFCLHLWKPQNAEIPAPPADLVGPAQAVRR